MRYIDMTHARSLAVLAFLGITGCVDAGPGVEPAAQSTRASELSSAVAAAPRTCQFVWLCEQDCPGFNPGAATNVEHMYCSDGSDTIIQKTDCANGCF
jgi:hypothetical protein